MTYELPLTFDVDGHTVTVATHWSDQNAVLWFVVLVDGVPAADNPFGFVNMPELTPDAAGQVVIRDVAYTDDPIKVLKVVISQALGF